jgi:hypothetical protein
MLIGSTSFIGSFVIAIPRYVRIDCSFCGVKMIDLHLCLSASVNARYILHIQPLGLYIIKF